MKLKKLQREKNKMAENLLVAPERDPDEGYTPDARVRRQLQRKLGKFIN